MEWDVTRGGQANFFKVRKSQIRKVLGSFRNRKSANFLGVPVRKSQVCNIFRFICKFLQNTAQLGLKTVLKVVFLYVFCVMYKFEL